MKFFISVTLVYGQLEKAKTFICIILQNIFTITIIETSSYLLMFPRTIMASQVAEGSTFLIQHFYK